MENKYFRASINAIPSNQSKIKNTAIPFFFSVDFRNEETFVPFIKETLIRCGKCNAYLNPYVEVIMPGYKWACNLCSFVNESQIPFQMKERKICENVNDPYTNSAFNKTYFVREELKNDVYELEAPESFNVSTADAPTFCFLIDVSLESLRLGVLSSVLNCIKETLKNLNYEQRTKFAFVFFNESVFVLNNNFTFTVINGEVPLVLSEKILFSLNPEFNLVTEIDFDKIEKYFSGKKSPNSHYLLAVKTAVQIFRSATFFSFISVAPNTLESKLLPSNSLSCDNKEYKTVAESLVAKNICANLCIMARTSVEFSSLKVLSQFTGGQVFHYSNYDGNDAVSTSKFFSDFMDYFNSTVTFGGICRIRCNEGVVLKDAYGNFYQKRPDLLSYSNFNPAHNINFSIQFFNNVKNALFIQIAMISVSKTGAKVIRIMNLFIPIMNTLYESCNANAIAHSLALECFYYESRKKLGGASHLDDRLSLIWSEIKKERGSIPENLANLPLLVLSLKKSIPLRPDSSTPLDFRGYYMYLLSNASTKVVDLIIYPLLLDITSQNVVPLMLSVSCIDDRSIYILDTGVNMFFYVGKKADSSVVASLFEDSKTGPIIFSPPENDFSKYVSELILFLLNSRVIKPRYILVRGNETSVYNDIFFSYMYNDSMHHLPSSVEFLNNINKN